MSCLVDACLKDGMKKLNIQEENQASVEYPI